MTDQSIQTPKSSRLFPGWHWVAVGFAFPVAGLIGWAVGGPVDSTSAALIGGSITGAGIGAAQWYAAQETFGGALAWIAASGSAYAVGLAFAAAMVGYATDIGSLITMGAISGLFLGVSQGLVLAIRGRARFAVVWAAAMPLLLALGWATSTQIGVDVAEQFTVFGAAGAAVFTLLSGMLVARFSSPGPRVSA